MDVLVTCFSKMGGGSGRRGCKNRAPVVIWEALELHFDILGVQLGSRGHHFDDPEVSRDGQQDTLESRLEF